MAVDGRPASEGVPYKGKREEPIGRSAFPGRRKEEPAFPVEGSWTQKARKVGHYEDF
jgi:hypothetical protein